MRSKKLDVFERGGIYEIRSSLGKRYIGSARHFRPRWNQHRAALSKGVHHSRYLQRAWNKYGANDFSFNVLLVCDEADAFFYEQRVIDRLKPEYNVSPTANGSRGLLWTEEAKQRIRGRAVSAATRLKLRTARLTMFTPEERREHALNMAAKRTPESEARRILKLTGRKDSEQTRHKKIERLRGRPVSHETRAKLALQAGWKHTEEAKAKMRATLAERVLSNADRARMADRVRGNKYRLGAVIPQEMRDQISAKLLGRARDPDAVAKQRATYAARRAAGMYGVLLTCAYCGSEFRVARGRVHTAKYCSKRCLARGRPRPQRRHKLDF